MDSTKDAVKAAALQFGLLYVFNASWISNEKGKPFPRSIRFYFYFITKKIWEMNPKYASAKTGDIRVKAIEPEVKELIDAIDSYKLVDFS